ncbi:MAG: hypothetical protein V1689_03055 [Pseudomonadota bacterium]
MDEMAILSHLEALAQGLEIKVRYENLEGETSFPSGGLCRLRNQQVIIVNERAPIREKIQTLAKALMRFDLNRVYIKPALRDLLEKGKGAGD